MNRLVLITGANRGLGKSFCDLFLANCRDGDLVVSLSRSVAADQQSVLTKPDSCFQFIRMDLADMDSASLLESAGIGWNNFNEVVFVNNAAVVEPIGQLGALASNIIQTALKTNVIGPTIIINFLLRVCAQVSLHIVHISSGAAKTPISGWGIYCSSKSYMDMLVRVTAAEHEGNEKVKVDIVDPGVLNTGMQEQIRRADSNGFPRHSDFVRLQAEGKLTETDEVALRILKQVSLLR